MNLTFMRPLWCLGEEGLGATGTYESIMNFDGGCVKTEDCTCLCSQLKKGQCRGRRGGQ